MWNQRRNLLVRTRLWCLGTSQRTTSIWSRMRYKGSTGAKSIAHCIPQSTTTKMLMQTSNIILSVSFQMATHTTPVLFTRFGHCWWNSWSRGSRMSQRPITFLMVVVGNIKISRTSLIYVPIKRTFPLKQSGFSLQLATGNHHVMELVVQWNAMLQNEVCRDHLTTKFWSTVQCWKYAKKKWSLLSIIFFGIAKEDMVEVREKMEKRFEDGKIVPVTRSSHHFTPQSASQFGHKLCSEDDLFVDIYDFKIPARVDIGNIAALSYISCM